MSEPVWRTEEHDGGIVVAAYDHAPMNYLVPAGIRELSALVDRWRSRSVRAVVLTSAHDGRFITHYSVEELLASTADRDAVVRSGRFRHDAFHAVLQRLSDLEKPVIAGMCGDAMGGGFELALACDIRVGQRGDVRYGLPETRLGIIPGGGGTQRLVRLIGAGRAVEFCLRGRVVPPEEALTMGLLHEVADDARARALELAHELAAMPPVALAMVKRAVYAGDDLPLSGGLTVERDACFAARLTDDALRAMEAFVALPLDERRDWLEGGSLPPFAGA